MRTLFLTIFILLLYVKVVLSQDRISNISENICLNYKTQYYVNKSRINSIEQEKKYLESVKNNYSVLDKHGSIPRSRIQSVINAKNNEILRLQRRNEFISSVYYSK